MPVHNTGIYLEECLSSVFNQTFQDFELICVDDCSKDIQTKEILKAYQAQHSNMTVLFLEQNVGAGEARNIGFTKAQGEYVIFLDADDVFKEDMLSQMYEKVVLENADICICGYTSFYVENNEKKYDLTIISTPKQVQEKDEEEWFLYQIYAPWNKLCKKSFLYKQDLKFQNLSTSNDVYFSCMALKKAEKISVISSALVEYRTNIGSQISANRNPFNFFAATKLLHEKLGDTEEINKQIFLMNLTGGWYELCACTDESLQKKTYEALRELCRQNEASYIRNPKLYYMRIGFINHSWESKWFVQNKDYLEQLRVCAKDIDTILAQEERIFLWGLGKRGRAFQQFCKEEGILLSGVADRENNSVGQVTEYGYKVISTKTVLESTGVIIASNAKIYAELSRTLGKKVVNLEQYCPL